MPTECERNSTLPSNNLESRMDKELDEMAASATNGHGNNSGTKISVTSPDPTSYVARARVTRPIPPKPSCNPMQFVQIKPCNLYQSAQQQLKKAEEVKKVKEIKKEEPEDWQNNLDNWKSSRRKRVEHIIDRVVEVKKLELEEHDRGRRKSKTFSEMIEERGDRPGRGRVKLASLAVYNEDESNDLSDLGIGTSSASGKSSLSEDYDNNSVISDNADIEKVLFDNSTQGGTSREYISSPGYDTSSSTAPASSPDPCEYTYEGAIQDYKTRVSRATSGSNSYKTNNNNIDVTSSTSKESQNDCSGGIGTMIASYQPRRGSKIEDRLMGFEVTSPNDTNENSNAAMLKMDLPKIDILKRKEIFENHTTPTEPQKSQGATVSNSKSRLQQSGDQNGLPKTTLKDRINDVEGKITSSSTQDPHSSAYTTSDEKNDIRRLSGGGEITSIKDRLQSLEQKNLVNAAKSAAAPKIVDVTVPPLRDRLSSLQNAATKEDVKKSPVCLVDARQLEIMKNEEEKAKLKLKGLKEVDSEGVAEIKTENVIDRQSFNEPPPSCQVFNEHHENNTITSNSTSSDTTIMEVLADRDDSGIQTADDISYSQLDDSENVHQAISENEERPSESSQDHHITLPNQKTEQNINKDEPKMTSLPAVVLVDHPSSEMEFSINEALELALEAIDKETEDNDDDGDGSMENSMKSEITTTMTTNTTTTTTTTTMTNRDENQNNVKLFEPIYENITAPASVSASASASTLTDKVNAKTNTSATLNTSAAAALYNPVPIVPLANQNQNLNGQASDESKPFSDIMMTAPPPPISILNPEDEPYYQVPKSSEPYYEVPKNCKPVPVYENIEIFYSNAEQNSSISATVEPFQMNSIQTTPFKMEPPKEKPPPPPVESPPLYDGGGGHHQDSSNCYPDNWGGNTYEPMLRIQKYEGRVDCDHPSPPIQRMNSTKRIKKELRNKRSSFLGIEGSLDDDESYLELTVAPPPDMAQLLQEERRLEKQLYMKVGLCDSSDTGESRDSGVSENHSRQSSEPFTNTSEETDHNDELLIGNRKEIDSLGEFHDDNNYLHKKTDRSSMHIWSEAATTRMKPLSVVTSADDKILSIEEKIREQEEVLRVERELLHFEQEEIKRQRETLIRRENLARRELQHGAKMLQSANRRSLQDLNGLATTVADQHTKPQQIYANLPNQIYQIGTGYRKSMPDLQEFNSKRLMMPPVPPSKPTRQLQSHKSLEQNQLPALSMASAKMNGNALPLNGGSLIKIASPLPQTPEYPNFHHSTSSLLQPQITANGHLANGGGHSAHTPHHSNMTRNTLHALSATPKPKYTDGWVHQRKTYDSNSNDSGWLSTSYQQKRKSVPDSFNYNNHWLVQEAEQRRVVEQQNRGVTASGGGVRSAIGGGYLTESPKTIQRNNNLPTPATNSVTSSGKLAAANMINNNNSKPLPDSIIQTLTERVQSKGIGDRKRYERFENYNNGGDLPTNKRNSLPILGSADIGSSMLSQPPSTSASDKVLSVSGKKKCSHCGDELGRGAAMIIESLLLFYHINCFKCCVCHVQLGDGLNGTDVRVRNHKLHCQNCYSSDDGIKFSCV